MTRAGNETESEESCSGRWTGPGSSLTWTGWRGLRTTDETVRPVPAHQGPHRADDLPLLLRVGRLLGDAQLVDDRLAGLDGDAGAVKGTAGDRV